jgi:hypothetical protein
MLCGWGLVERNVVVSLWKNPYLAVTVFSSLGVYGRLPSDATGIVETSHWQIRWLPLPLKKGGDTSPLAVSAEKNQPAIKMHSLTGSPHPAHNVCWGKWVLAARAD